MSYELKKFKMIHSKTKMLLKYWIIYPLKVEFYNACLKG